MKPPSQTRHTPTATASSRCCARCQPDTAFFWEGTEAGELRIQHCPVVRAAAAPAGTDVPGGGAGTAGPTTSSRVTVAGHRVFSYVVHHAPEVPGKTLPFVVALVELEEGVRMVAELVDVEPPPSRSACGSSSR